MSPLVWFQLLDSVTGEPYKGTTADKVSVSSSADVADFRDAVIEKFEKSSVLTGYASSQLLVYKNKAAFVDGKEDEEDSLIDGLGRCDWESVQGNYC